MASDQPTAKTIRFWRWTRWVILAIGLVDIGDAVYRFANRQPGDGWFWILSGTVFIVFAVMYFVAVAKWNRMQAHADTAGTSDER